MKVALVHDYMKEYGGAERVLETLHEMFPEAPVYTSVYLPEFLGPHKDRFKQWDIRTSFLQKFPFKAKLISPFRLFSPLAFRSFDFSEYDVVIVSATGAYFPNSIHVKGKHICYCHTPPRYLYGYATAREWKKNPIMNVIGTLVNYALRIVDYRYSKNVDQYIANSEEVKERIKRFYNKDAVVIYPPVSVVSDQFSAVSKNRNKTAYLKDYFVAGGRLARAKHIDFIVKTCVQQGIPLKVFGKGFAGYEEEITSLIQSKNVEYLGEISDEEKWELLAGAKAYIFAAEDEDFGILPVEAMAAGIPVVAYRSGGVRETVVEGRTGVFFDALKEESLFTAIQECEKKSWNKEHIVMRAKEFSKERFVTRIKMLTK